MPLESDIRDVLECLDQKAATHPKIATFWKHYISRKITMLEKSLNDCEHVMESLGESQCDVEPEALAAAYLFAVTLRGNGSSTEV